MINKALNHLEELLVTFLMGRRPSSSSFRWPTATWPGSISRPAGLAPDLNFSWAQELCIIMFVWMAKFGAAYGVRTGIHVGRRCPHQPAGRQRAAKFIVFGLLAGALFTGTVGALGAHFVWETAPTTPFSNCSASTRRRSRRSPPRPTWNGRPGSSIAPFPLGSS